MALVGITFFGTFIWDRLVTAIFAPEIFGAMMSEARNTTFADIVPVIRNAAKVGAVVGVIMMANNSQPPIS